MKYIYKETEYINDFSDYVFQRLESAYGEDGIPSITLEPSYFSKIEEIEEMVTKEQRKTVDELARLVDKYLAEHLVLIYRIAYLDGLCSQKKLADSEITII